MILPYEINKTLNEVSSQVSILKIKAKILCGRDERLSESKSRERSRCGRKDIIQRHDTMTPKIGYGERLTISDKQGGNSYRVTFMFYKCIDFR